MVSVFVIGGGPAGLAAAIAARQQGFAVTVADARQPPIDKACGEGLMPDGVELAVQLGLDLRDAEPMRGVRFLSGRHQVEAPFPKRNGYVFRRLDLHQALVRKAEQQGVKLLWNTPVKSPPPESDWIIQACGTPSSSCRTRYGFRQHFQVKRWTDFLEVHWAKGLQLYITPVRPDEVGIAVLSRNPKMRVETALAKFPELRARMGPAASSERGSVTGARHTSHVVRGNVALVGDASGTVDAITGEGLALSFRQAFSLAHAMRAGDLSIYEEEHRRMFQRPRLMENLLLTMDKSEALRALAFSAMTTLPAIFRGLLAFHVNS